MTNKNGYSGGELDPDEYRRAEGIESRPHNLPTRPKRKNRFFNIDYHYRDTLFDNLLLYTTFSLPVIITAGALLFVNQDKKEHPGQIFKLPPAKEAPEVENPPESSRQFITTALLAGKIVCPPSFIRKGNAELTKPLLPVVKTNEELPVGRVIFTRESVTSNTDLDRLVTCSYPQSNPKEIMHIPVLREGR